MGVGAAMTGLRPIVEGMNMGFLLLAFSQISNNAGMLHYTSGGNFKVPMVVRGPGGASAGPHTPGVHSHRAPDSNVPAALPGVGRQLGAEHSQRLESYFQAIPGALTDLNGVLRRLLTRSPARLGCHRRAARCLQHSRERKGAAEVGHPQRQPHCFLRGAQHLGSAEHSSALSYVRLPRAARAAIQRQGRHIQRLLAAAGEGRDGPRGQPGHDPDVLAHAVRTLTRVSSRSSRRSIVRADRAPVLLQVRRGAGREGGGRGWLRPGGD